MSPYAIRAGGALALAALLVLPAACKKSGDGSPTAPSPPTQNSRVVYTALGASDAVGIGASVPCVPFVACPDGTGYVPAIARGLATGGRQVQTTNLGIPGAVISPEIQQLGNRYGRGIPANFLQGEVPFVPRDSTVVTIFAGGNDTNAIGVAVEAGEGGADPRAFIDQQVAGFRQSYDALVRGVRERAPSARIVVANLPNMAGLRYASPLSLTQRGWLQRISVGFTREAINPLASQNVIVVDLLCDSRSYDPSNYSSDGFHPNDRGYAYMAEVLLRAIESGAASPVSADCPQATMVPGT